MTSNCPSDPSLLVDCRSTPRRPLNHPDLTHDWTPQHYPSGAIGGYYCPDCLIAGAPVSAPCPDRVRALVAERDELRELLAEQQRAFTAGLEVSQRTADTESDELRLEIAALRGDKAGAISERWVWVAPCWVIRDEAGKLLAKVATTNLLAWTLEGVDPATSIRDGMRRCEARLAGGAS